jgi:probable F420-dependent oxidoreductase
VRLGGSIALDWLADLGAVREVAQGLDGAGFDYATSAGHVLTAAPGRYPDRPDVTYALPYRDPFVLFTHLASCTRSIRLRTGIMILPLYPTALVARQAADAAEIMGGRLELGVGISWQEAEYDALGQDVHRRGARLEEQIEVLRLMWSAPRITFHGRQHDIDDLGLGAVPAAAIPIWIGCQVQEKLLRRVARLADGWMPIGDPVPHLDQLRGYIGEAGRDPGAVGVAGRLTATGEPEAWVAEAARLAGAGVSDLTISSPPGASPQEGLAAMLAAREAIIAA